MFIKKLVFTIILLAFTNGVSAQDVKQLEAMEDSLVSIADSMYNAFLPEDKIASTERFVKKLVAALKTPNSYSYPFNKLKDKINIIHPDDKRFRVFNWATNPSEVTTRYYGAIQMSGEQLKLYPLIDYTGELKEGAEDSVLTNSKWFGAIYYHIIRQEVDGQDVYTMFGKNAANIVSDKKILDPMIITEKGIVFGAPIFNVRSQANPNERIKRFIIEYKKGVQASMNWDAEMSAIFFDRLASEQNDPNRKYTFVPTGQYDGFRWDGGYWNYVKDLIPIDVLSDGKAPVPVPVKGKE
jgi:hypothetical protein